jgi:hypothetical protein
MNDPSLLANYPSGAVDIGEGIVIARDVENSFARRKVSLLV